jgi:hypothetical protein
MERWWEENMLRVERPRSAVEVEWMRISGIGEDEYIETTGNVVEEVAGTLWVRLKLPPVSPLMVFEEK